MLDRTLIHIHRMESVRGSVVQWHSSGWSLCNFVRHSDRRAVFSPQKKNECGKEKPLSVRRFFIKL
jgi:hypothetical protein